MEQKPPVIPWIDICNNPNHYYDKVTFNVPARIRDPKDYLDNPADVFPLLKFFSNAAASGYLFHFLSFNSLSDDSGFELVEEVIPGLNPSLSLTDVTTSGGAIFSCADNTSTPPPSSPISNTFEQAEMVTMPHRPSIPKDVATLPGLVMVNGLPPASVLVLTLFPDNPPSLDVIMAESTESHQKKGSKTGPESPVTTKIGKKKVGKGNKNCLEVLVASNVAPSRGAVVMTKVGKKKGWKGVKAGVKALAMTSMPSTSSVTVSPMADELVPALGVAGSKRRRMEVETQPEDLGPCKRKVTKRARGIGYNESTASDEGTKK